MDYAKYRICKILNTGANEVARDCYVVYKKVSKDKKIFKTDQSNPGTAG